MKSALAWELCLDGRGRNISFRYLKLAAQRIEQWDNPEIRDDLEPRSAIPPSTPDHNKDKDGLHKRLGNRPNYGNYWNFNRTSSMPAVRATHSKGPEPEFMEEEMDEMYQHVNLNDYEGIEEMPMSMESLLPPHIKAAHIVQAYEVQERRCYFCHETGHFRRECPKWLKLQKDKGNLNAKGALKL